MAAVHLRKKRLHQFIILLFTSLARVLGTAVFAQTPASTREALLLGSCANCGVDATDAFRSGRGPRPRTGHRVTATQTLLRLETRTPLPTRLRIAFRLTFKRRTLFVSRESYPS